MPKEMWDRVEGTAEQPEEAEAQGEYEKAKQKEVVTLVIVILSSLIYPVASCSTPHDVWETRKTQFQRKTLANKLFLKRQYMY